MDVEIKSKIKIEGLSKDAEKVKDNIINLIRQAEETKRVLHCFDRVCIVLSISYFILFS